MVKLASPSKKSRNSDRSVARFTDNKTALLVYYGLVLAIIFMSVYVVLAISDAIYNTNTTILKSNVFILNLLVLILLIVGLFMEKMSGKRVTYARVVVLMTILGLSIGSSVELRNLVDQSPEDQDREDTTQFIISVIGLLFTVMATFALLLGNIMSLVSA